MDQLKQYLALLVKHHFWVLSGVTVILGLIGWFLAADALADYYKQRKIKIEGQFNKTQQIIAKENHPNPTFEAAIDKLLDQKDVGLKSRVLAAWNLSYKQQKDNVLIWPKELGDDFLQYIQATPADVDVPVEFRERYFNYVRAEFPKLLAIVDAQNFNELGSGAGRAASDPDPAKKAAHDYKVIWHSADQKLLDEALDWPRTPTAKEMRYTQENLWVYEALLGIVARINESATGHYNARIKEIISLQIARPAAQEFQAGMGGGKLIPPQPTGAPSPVGPGMAPQPVGPGGGVRPPSRPGGGPQQAVEAVQEEGRYVDGKGQPLAAGAVSLPEFKRMPVFLQLFMDQREISRLLVECANSPLPIEVKQVRINPLALRRSGRAEVTSIFTAAGKRGGVPGGQVATSDVADLQLNPYDVPVEIQGIIYIFNPPNRAKLAVAGQTDTAEPNAENPAAAEGAAKEPGAEPPPAANPSEAPAAGNPAAGNPAAGNPANGNPANGNPAEAPEAGALPGAPAAAAPP